ncbi:MAG: DUF6268 family outer membrane beta-barrel protein [Planctomycetota bacterium]
MPPATIRSTAAALAPALLALAVAPAAAQLTDAPPDETTERLPRPSFSWRAATLYNATAGIDTGGELSVLRINGGFDIRLPIDRRTRFRFNAETFQSFYDTNNVTGTLVPGRLSTPFDTVHEYDIYAGIESSISGDWSWYAGARISSGGESGADFNDTLTYGGLFGVRYQATDTLAIGVGLNISTQLEDDVWIIPIPSIDWQIDEGVRLFTEFRRIGLGFQITDSLEIGAWGRFERHEFRLNDDPGTPEGVVRETRFPIGFFAEFQPATNISIRAEMGGTAFGEFEIIDENGDELFDTNIDTSFALGLHLNVRF